MAIPIKMREGGRCAINCRHEWVLKRAKCCEGLENGKIVICNAPQAPPYDILDGAVQ